MKFHKDKAYKVIEFRDGLIITEMQHDLKDPTAKPLIVATAGDLLTYLDRYFYEREHGKGMLDAHNAALQTAGVTQMVKPS